MKQAGLGGWFTSEIRMCIVALIIRACSPLSQGVFVCRVPWLVCGAAVGNDAAGGVDGGPEYADCNTDRPRSN